MEVSLSNLNNEELLLMYLSGELDADAARQVEAQLARDENLRAQFESLKQMDVELKQWAGDENRQPVPHLDASLRTALTAMRKHTLTSPLSRGEQDARSRASGWKWRIAIAALLIAGLTVMFVKRSNHEVAVNPDQPVDPVKNTLVAVATQSNGYSDYAGMYDMFNAPMTERAADDPLIQDVAAVTEMAQMLR